MNAANLFDRNPLHVAHLQGPVDRLHDTNLRAIYERAGRILLIQRWKDLSASAPHAFLLFETEQAANSCCNRIGAPRITTPNNSHPQSITASILQPNQPNHPALQQWLSSQNMVPSYVIKNPPEPPKAAGFPLSCLRVLGEDSSDVVSKLKEFKCGPGWWRFVAQMYVANKLWAAARMVLKCEKEPEDDVIDISDDSVHEHASDDDQPGQMSSKSSAGRPSHNVWLPSKRNVNGARAKLGVVTSKPGTVAAKPGSAKAGKLTSGSEAPPFVPTPMSETPPTDAAPQASQDTPPTVPATLPMTRSDDTLPKSGTSTAVVEKANGLIVTPQPDGAKSNSEPTPAQSLPSSQPPMKSPAPVQVQHPVKSSTSQPPPSSLVSPSQPTNPNFRPINPIPPDPSSARPIVPTPLSTLPVSTLDKPIPSIARSNDMGLNDESATAPDSKPTGAQTGAPPTGPRALMKAFGPSFSNLSSSSATTTPSALARSPRTTPTPTGTNGIASASDSLTTQPVDRPTNPSRQSHTSQETPSASRVKKEAEQVTLEDHSVSVSQDSPIVPIPQSSSTVLPAQDSSAREKSPVLATQAAPSITATLGSSSTQSTQAPPPAEESSVVPMEEDSFFAPTEGDSSFGVPSEELFSVSIALTEDTSSIIPSNDLPAPATQNASITKDSKCAPSAENPSPSCAALSATPRALARTPIRSPPREPLSFFGISSSPSSLPVSLPSTSSPTKRKSDMLETRLIKRRRHRTSSSKSEPIIVEPEISALEAEKARAAELQAEEDRVRELLGVDMSDYAESVMARLSGSDKASTHGIISSSDKSKSPARGTPSVESDIDLELRSLRAMRDENEALKMKIKVLELTLPTAESVKNELYAERKHKSQLIEALEIEKSLLTQSEALRRQSDSTREGLQQRIRQLEERLSESAGALERARELAQVAAEQRRKAEEASAAAEAERTKLRVLLDAERDLVSRERVALAEERSIKAEAQARLAATEARLAAEQRRYTEAMDQANKERTESKNFLDAEKAIVSAQEAKLEREREIRSELEAKLRELEEKLKEEQLKRVEDKKSADSFLQNELTTAMKLVTAEREITKAERAKTVAEAEARGLVEKEIVLLKEQLATSEKQLREAQDGNQSMKRDLATFKDQLNESERREGMLRAELSTAGSRLVMTEGRARATEDRAAEAEHVSKRHMLEFSKLQEELASEKTVLMMERQALAKERISRKELESKLVVAEERLAVSVRQTNELRAQLQNTTSSGQGTREQLQTQRALLHIARTRIQELEQAIQRVESDLDAARSAEAAAKTMVQLWGPHPRTQLSSPISDIVDHQGDQMDTEPHPFIPLMKPPRQQSFKLKRTVAPARLLKVDMPSGESASIDLGGLPANPDTIIDLLYRSRCAGVFWDIIMDEYGAMGCFDAAEAIAEGKLKYQP
ncbi:hypothetical protein OPQ81_009483 [Rhizoctonia solani]|nr:hypothetical protein OPQ81_009483 [Rhizoctonia solani]